MKATIEDRLTGKIQAVYRAYETIEAFFPQLGDGLIDELLTFCASAWDIQTQACAVCPVRCISEKDERAPMFDDPLYWQ